MAIYFSIFPGIYSQYNILNHIIAKIPEIPHVYYWIRCQQYLFTLVLHLLYQIVPALLELL